MFLNMPGKKKGDPDVPKRRYLHIYDTYFSKSIRTALDQHDLFDDNGILTIDVTDKEVYYANSPAILVNSKKITNADTNRILLRSIRRVFDIGKLCMEVRDRFHKHDVLMPAECNLDKLFLDIYRTLLGLNCVKVITISPSCLRGIPENHHIHELFTLKNHSDYYPLMLAITDIDVIDSETHVMLFKNCDDAVKRMNSFIGSISDLNDIELSVLSTKLRQDLVQEFSYLLFRNAYAKEKPDDNGYIGYNRVDPDPVEAVKTRLGRIINILEIAMSIADDCPGKTAHATENVVMDTVRLAKLCIHNIDKVPIDTAVIVASSVTNIESYAIHFYNKMQVLSPQPSKSELLDRYTKYFKLTHCTVSNILMMIEEELPDGDEEEN